MQETRREGELDLSQLDPDAPRDSMEEHVSSKKLWKIGIRGKMWRTMKKVAECLRRALMPDEEISKYVDILQEEFRRDVHDHPIYSSYIFMT